MTGMEQGLRYIEREIRFMVKDQFGNPTYAKYADRVIEDATGVPNFCTTVLSSKKPLSVILRVVKGSKGDSIVRFFNASLHDARTELVMVLAEATKLRSNRSSGAHDYLCKLYKKAIRKTIRLITGSKAGKDSYKTKYKNLRKFVEDGDYFDSDEFEDSKYADFMTAYQGDIPSEPAISYSGSTKIKGNEDLLKEISSIESKLGRHLTDAELDQFICGDDDDSEESTPPADMDSISDKLAELVFSKVMKKLQGAPKANSRFESLDDFLAKQPQERGNEDSSSENTVCTEEGTDDKNSEDSNEDSGSLPPNDELGGDSSKLETENYEDTSAASMTEDLFTLCIPKIDHSLQMNEIINDFTKNVLNENAILGRQISNYITSLLTVSLTDIEVVLSPSVDKDMLLESAVNIRVAGDINLINQIHLNTILFGYTKKLAKVLDIPERMINAKIRLSISSESFTGLNMYDITNALSALAIYIYRRLGNIFNIRAYIDKPNKKLYISFMTNGDYPIESFLVYAKETGTISETFKEFVDTELIGEGIINELFNTFYVSEKYEINYIFGDLDDYLNGLNTVLKSSEELSYIRRNLVTNFIEVAYNSVELYDESANITFHGITPFVGQKAVGLELRYVVHLKEELSAEAKKEFLAEISNESSYKFGMEDLLHSISNDIEVNTYIEYSVDDEYSADDEDGTESGTN